jgi:hypothetical protein
MQLNESTPPKLERDMFEHAAMGIGSINFIMEDNSNAGKLPRNQFVTSTPIS